VKKYSAVAFVPARKNSKRLPGKNKKLLNGKPLFQYTIEAAVNSGCYETVILTSDDEEILSIGNKIEGVSVIERPLGLAGDDVRAVDVVLHHLNVIGEEYDYVSLLMATSPFRSAEDIKVSFEMLLKESGDSLVSVVKYGFQPCLALRIRNNRLRSYFDRDIQWKRENEFEDAYHVNGAIYTSKTELLFKTKTFIHNGTIAYLMNALKSIDIDTEIDLQYAEFLHKEHLV
jgi:CMP-N,N'-diacetyllegionaminic acid synthase